VYGWGLGGRVHRQCEAVGHVAAHEVAHAEVHAEAHVEVVVVDIFNDEVWSWWNTFTCVADALLICHTQTQTQTSDGIEMGGGIWKVWQ